MSAFIDRLKALVTFEPAPEYCAEVTVFHHNKSRAETDFCAVSETARDQRVAERYADLLSDALTSCNANGFWKPNWHTKVSCRGGNLSRIDVGVTQFGQGEFSFMGVPNYEGFEIHRMIHLKPDGTVNTAAEEAYYDGLPLGL